MAGLREALESAIEQHREEPEEQIITPEQSAEPVESAEAKADRVRDEQGKFAKQEKKEEKPVQAAAPIEQQAVDRPARPTSWKKEYWEHFDKLDPNVAKYINEREQDFHKGIEGYKARAQQAMEWEQAVAPFMENFRAVGKMPAAAVRDILATENALRNGSPQQKLGIIQTLIREYGIDVSGRTQPQQQPAFDPNQINQVVEQRVAAMMTEREVNSALNQFMANPPEHFDAVKETMVQLLQSNAASSYQEAYDKAVWLNPEVREAILAKQQGEAAAKQRDDAAKVAAAAKAKAVSVKGSSTGKQTSSNGSDRRALIAEALRGAQSRV